MKTETDKETVAEIVGEMRGIKGGQHTNGGLSFERWRARCQFADDYADRIEAAHKREIADLRRRLKVAEDALEKSPCGVIYQLGLVDDDGNDYCGCAVKFSEEENEKMPRVGMGDKFFVVPYNSIAAIREEGGEP